MSNLKARRDVLRSYGADGDIITELLAYNENAFTPIGVNDRATFPLADEEFVETWARYLAEAPAGGLFDYLKSRLVQLNFPISEGISRSDHYAAVVRRGSPPEISTESGRLNLRRPEALRLSIHQTPAGKIPILTIPEREDFVSLVRALTTRNEPESVPDAMGACIVSGYNNWDRVWAYRAAWSGELGRAADESAWAAEFQNLISRKSLYQDRFILLSEGFYSSVPPDAMGLSSHDWRDVSLTIRREHECAHYFTRRVFGSMRNTVLDELIADYAGLTAAIGTFRSDWFLRFMGIEPDGSLHAGGRLGRYRGNPPLSGQAFCILSRMLIAAAESVEEYSLRRWLGPHPDPLDLAALSTQTIEELAIPGSSKSLIKIVQQQMAHHQNKEMSCES